MNYNFKDHINIVSRKGSQLLGHSPFRKDKNPSFSANEDSGLWMDHGTDESGDYDEFLRRLGSKSHTDRALRNNNSASKKKVATEDYFYNDVGGEELLKITRIDYSDGSKRFYASNWSDQSWKKGKPKTVVPPMGYSSWTPQDRHIHIFEGEKSQQAGERVLKGLEGHLATCFPFGSSKTPSGLKEFMNGKVVFLHPDQDKAGISFCKKIAVICETEKIEFRFLKPISKINGGDIWDWENSLNLKGKSSKEITLLFIEYIGNENNIYSFEREVEEEKEPLIVSLNEIEQSDVDWLIPNLIVKGDVNSISGEPGIGKSSVIKSIIAGVTMGASPIDGIVIEKGNVLLISFEEDPSKVVRPKLEAQGADLSKVYLPPKFEDLDRLCESEKFLDLMENIKPVLIVIDPIVAFKTEKSDMNNSSAVRTNIKTFNLWARTCDAAVVFIAHFNKSLSGKATFRTSGSVDLTAGVRSEMQVYEHPEAKNRRILVQSKSNYSKIKDFGYVYEITESGLVWHGEAQYTANQLAMIEQEKVRQDSCINALLFLFKTLRNGSVESDQLFKLAATASIAKRTLEMVKPRVTQWRRVGERGKIGGGHVLIDLKDDFKPCPDLRTKERGGA